MPRKDWRPCGKWRRVEGADLFVLGGFLAADAAPQKTKADNATGQKNSRKEKVSPAAASVDLNNASEKDLDSLPGVGPATARRSSTTGLISRWMTWPKPGSRPRRLNAFGQWLRLAHRRPKRPVDAPFRTNPPRRYQPVPPHLLDQQTGPLQVRLQPRPRLPVLAWYG